MPVKKRETANVCQQFVRPEQNADIPNRSPATCNKKTQCV